MGEPVRHALAEALGAKEPVRIEGPTVGVEGAAVLLLTTPGAIYERRRLGKMPRAISGRPLVWRVSDILKMEE